MSFANKFSKTIVSLVPVREFRDWDFSNPRTLNCKNHPYLTWYWKGPGRNLHYSGGRDSSNIFQAECDCPFDLLQVIVESSRTI